MSTTAVAPTSSQLTSRSSDNDDKFLTFHMGREEYGIEILKVREIIAMMDITPIPQTPIYVKGVINLRGKIIPVIELRRKFDLDVKEYDEQTCIIVADVEDPETGEQFQIGVIVDAVSEVLDIPRDKIDPAPKFGCSVNTEYIHGMGKVKDKVVTLLAIDRILTTNEMVAIANVANETSEGAESASSEEQTD